MPQRRVPWGGGKGGILSSPPSSHSAADGDVGVVQVQGGAAHPPPTIAPPTPTRLTFRCRW